MDVECDWFDGWKGNNYKKTINLNENEKVRKSEYKLDI